MPVIKCADLFTGIGGISIALKPFVKTIIYCERDKYCQHVLDARMQDNYLDKAPVHNDVSTLHFSSSCLPDMICGGYPCQDISSMGLQRGITPDTRSGLFYEIMRLVDEYPTINALFLENVSNIAMCGMREVIHELRLRNFTFAWLMKSAGSLGAPHQRMRWFCFAIRNGFDVSQFNIEETDINSFPCTWDTPTSQPRVTFKPVFKEDPNYDPNWSHRCQTLGNSVVPIVVQKAFKELVKIIKNVTHITDCFSSFSTAATSLDYPYPDGGIVHGDRFYALPKYHQEVVMLPCISTTIRNGNTTHTLDRLPTPRKGITYASSLTDRSIRDLPTILVNCEESKEYLRTCNVDVPTDKPPHAYMIANVKFIEWMMGYPEDYTKAPKYNNTKATTTPTTTNITTTATTRKPKQSLSLSSSTRRYNGMHVLMKENPGKTIKMVAQIWNELNDEQKREYSQKARMLN